MDFVKVCRLLCDFPIRNLHDRCIIDLVSVVLSIEHVVLGTGNIQVYVENIGI